jgi:hypothetical protein
MINYLPHNLLVAGRTPPHTRKEEVMWTQPWRESLIQKTNLRIGRVGDPRGHHLGETKGNKH